MIKKTSYKWKPQEPAPEFAEKVLARLLADSTPHLRAVAVRGTAKSLGQTKVATRLGIALPACLVPILVIAGVWLVSLDEPQIVPLASSIVPPEPPRAAPEAVPSGAQSAPVNTGQMDVRPATAPQQAPSAAKKKDPIGFISIDSTAVSDDEVANAWSVVSGMQAGFRRCYNQGLRKDPTMKGSVRINARIGSNGQVLSAIPAVVSGLSSTVVSCVVLRVQSVQFAAPKGGSATIVIPASFRSSPERLGSGSEWGF